MSYEEINIHGENFKSNLNVFINMTCFMFFGVFNTSNKIKKDYNLKTQIRHNYRTEVKIHKANNIYSFSNFVVSNFKNYLSFLC